MDKNFGWTAVAPAGLSWHIDAADGTHTVQAYKAAGQGEITIALDGREIDRVKMTRAKESVHVAKTPLFVELRFQAPFPLSAISSGRPDVLVLVAVLALLSFGFALVIIFVLYMFFWTGGILGPIEARLLSPQGAISAGGRISIDEPVLPVQPPAPAPVSAPAQPVIVQQSTPAAMVPDIPARCAACGAPLSMDTLNWTGPLSAACKTCGASVPIQWKKVGT